MSSCRPAVGAAPPQGEPHPRMYRRPFRGRLCLLLPLRRVNPRAAPEKPELSFHAQLAALPAAAAALPGTRLVTLAALTCVLRPRGGVTVMRWGRRGGVTVMRWGTRGRGRCDAVGDTRRRHRDAVGDTGEGTRQEDRNPESPQETAAQRG